MRRDGEDFGVFDPVKGLLVLIVRANRSGWCFPENLNDPVSLTRPILRLAAVIGRRFHRWLRSDQSIVEACQCVGGVVVTNKGGQHHYTVDLYIYFSIVLGCWGKSIKLYYNPRR